ncbi:MAG TPA: hypothetical protein VMO47_11135 [Rhodothermales bacterium]|nr:hypothetical protein [Rhodothermales bacterium]
MSTAPNAPADLHLELERLRPYRWDIDLVLRLSVVQFDFPAAVFTPQRTWNRLVTINPRRNRPSRVLAVGASRFPARPLRVPLWIALRKRVRLPLVLPPLLLEVTSKFPILSVKLRILPLKLSDPTPRALQLCP